MVHIVTASSKLVIKLHGPYALFADGYGVRRKSRAEHVECGNILLVEGVAHEHRGIEVAACNAVPSDPEIGEVVAGKILAQIAAEFVGEEIISAEAAIAAQTRQRHGIGSGDRAGKNGSRQRNRNFDKADAERRGCCALYKPAVYCGAVEPQ